jgi:hypothetical protein
MSTAFSPPRTDVTSYPSAFKSVVKTLNVLGSSSTINSLGMAAALSLSSVLIHLGKKDFLILKK